MERLVYGRKPVPTVEGQDSVDLESILLLYKVAGCIYVISVIIFISECVYKRLKKRKKKSY